ncbi:endonuclease/exonuclease/phosphatase family protein [Bacteroides sp. 224]|uniref:endonuclease/exonuclease/phosphatase family protein n=1 Tax=Bacteroides sp. 224 TaxID=2302936 RepID=UPI0013D20B93|nr:endonuclease/exonuclease/phosphatase family protein [Bacteroides sp. 224]NDV66120.1 endonuclease/exonuclease/phosphatase family protein [Bacteroides sp. 224]
MKKWIILGCVLLLFCVCTSVRHTQKTKGLYSIAFYNVENLFDTVPDPGKNDAEYLPYGTKEWNTEKYTAKLKKIAQVLSELGRDKTSQGPAVIGLAEVENIYALHDLVREPAIADIHYGIVHYEGEDRRGIDCALLYDPKQFKPEQTVLIPHKYQNNDTTHLTRGFLLVKGKLAKEEVCFIVNHWPSRGAAAPARIWAAGQVRVITDSLTIAHPKLNIMVMGDMNDDPMDESMTTALGARKYKDEVGKGDFYNPWWETLEDKGIGTLLYRGKWNLFDQIVLSSTLLNNEGLKFDSHEVFLRDYLIQQGGKYKGSPLRTHGGKEWLNGYSDHLPTIVYLRK